MSVNKCKHDDSLCFTKQLSRYIKDECHDSVLLWTAFLGHAHPGNVCCLWLHSPWQSGYDSSEPTSVPQANKEVLLRVTVVTHVWSVPRSDVLCSVKWSWKRKVIDSEVVCVLWSASVILESASSNPATFMWIERIPSSSALCNIYQQMWVLKNPLHIFSHLAAW